MTGKYKRSLIFKAISVFIALTFSFSGISFAVTDDTLGAPGKPKLLGPVEVEDIGVAIDTGTIKSKYQGDTGKVVVHIQDAHCNYEAQSNINKMLEQLSRELGIDMVSVEGAEGIVDTAWFRAFPDSEIRKEVATYFMKKGEITGAEYFSINSPDYNGIVFGAENREYYIKNLRAFTDVYPYKEMIENYFLNMQTVGGRLKGIVYGPQLKELDLKITSFDDKDIELSEFAAYLAALSRKTKTDAKDLENFSKLLDTLEYEEKIDFEVVDSERTAYIDVLSKKMGKEKMADLVTKSIKFKKGHIKSVEFYTYLRDLAKEYEIDIVQEYPNLFYYYIYTKLYAGIDNEGLFKEMDTLENRLKETLFEDETQATLDKYSNMLNMYIDLANIELTNEDYEQFQQNKKDFDLEDVLRFFGKLSDQYNLNYEIGTLPQQISQNVPRMVEFYEIAMKRDRALIENTIKEMDKKGTDRCVLIAGGFHTKGMKELLEAQGISYVVVTPKITKDVETPYIKVLTNQRTTLEDIVTEAAAMPGVIASREDIIKPRKDLVTPMLRTELIAKLLDGTLGDIERALGKGVDGRKLTEMSEEFLAEIVQGFVSAQFVKYQRELRAQFSSREEFLEYWQKMVDDKWETVRNGYVDKYAINAEKLGVIEKVIKNMTGAISTEFDAIFSKSPGQETGGRQNNESLTDDARDIIDKSIAATINDIKKNKGLSEEEFQQQYQVTSVATGGTFIPLPDEIYEGHRARILNEYIERYIAQNGQAGLDAYRAGVEEILDVICSPGTRQTRLEASRGPGQKSRIRNYYILQSVLDSLTPDEKDTMARHEEAHIDIALNIGDHQNMTDFATEEEYVNALVGADITPIVSRLAEEKAALENRLVDNAGSMAASAEKGEAPDVVIVTSSTDAQADFWRNRLTKDGIYGTGTVVKEDAVVLSVSEASWDGNAGNGLGTLNGYVQAAKKAQVFGLIQSGVDVLKPKLTEQEIQQLVNAFMDYCNNKAVFMFHTAGNGTRTAPMPGAEVNSKPNIKLPKVIDVKGSKEPITILESVIMETNIYAPSRKDRLSVFWGDQVIINELDVNPKPSHHVEIFGMMVPIDKSIEAYGVLIPGEKGDAKQREKLPAEKVRELAGGSDKAYKSIGSFSQSNPFLKMMLTEHSAQLSDQSGKLDTDPDWWQPLTSTEQEYVIMMKAKGKTENAARTQWRKMNSLWSSFSDLASAPGPSIGPEIPTTSGPVGFTDVGEHALWWDYGQNTYYINNLLLLTADSMQGRTARAFFGVPEDVWQQQANYADEFSSLGGANVSKSIIMNSTIENEAGDSELENCIVINSTLKNVKAKNAIIIGSTILDLNMVGGLSYNVVDHAVNIQEGQILANIFHPREGRIEMRTDASRDGQADWKGEVYVYDNGYTYGQISKLMADNVSKQQVDGEKQKSIGSLDHVLAVSPKEAAQKLLARRTAAAEAFRAAGENELAENTAITFEEAAQLVAHRMLKFGDIESFTPQSYANTFGISIERAREVLEVDSEYLPDLKNGEIINNVMVRRAYALFEKQTNNAEELATAKKHIAEWLTEDRFKEYQPALISLVELAERESEALAELYDSFRQVNPFGTGGRRSLVGLGPNRMNAYMAAITAQGACEFQKQQHGFQEGDTFVDTYDVRGFREYFAESPGKTAYREVLEEKCPIIAGLTSADLSKVMAVVAAGNGYRYVRADDVRSTPLLSFMINNWNELRQNSVLAGILKPAIRAVCGIVLSSSHNPFDNNGTKFYEISGSQAPPRIVQTLMDIGNNVQAVEYYEDAEALIRDQGLSGLDIAYRKAVAAGRVIELKGKSLVAVDDAYTDVIVQEVVGDLYTEEEQQELNGAIKNTQVSFHALNGTGDTCLLKSLDKMGFPTLRSEKDVHDSQFSDVVANIPNPESEKAFNTAMNIGVERTLAGLYRENSLAITGTSYQDITALIDEDGRRISIRDVLSGGPERDDAVLADMNSQQLIMMFMQKYNKYIRGVVLNTPTKKKETDIREFSLDNNITLMTDPDADRCGLALLKIGERTQSPDDPKVQEVTLGWVSANDNDESGIILFRHRLERLADMAENRPEDFMRYLQDKRQYINEKRREAGVPEQPASDEFQLVMVTTVVSNPLEEVITQKISERIEKATQGKVMAKVVRHPVGFKFTGDVINTINTSAEYDTKGIVATQMKTAEVDLDKAMFVMSSEEGEGSLIGFMGSIDKDSGVTGAQLAVIAAEQRAQGKTLHDYLMETYKNYGYSKTYLEPMVLAGGSGMRGIKVGIMQNFFRGDIVNGIANLGHYQLGRFRVTEIQDMYELMRNEYGEDVSKWPTAIQESVNIVQLTLEDPKNPGTRIKVVARPSGTEPKHKDLVMVVGTPEQTIEEINALNREVMDAVTMGAYRALSRYQEQANDGVEYASKIAENPAPVRISEITPEVEQELLRIYPIIVSDTVKFGVYFPLRNWIIRRSDELSQTINVNVASYSEEFNETRDKVLEYLVYFQKENGIQFIEESVILSLRSELSARNIDVNNPEAVRPVAIQTALWFGRELSDVYLSKIGVPEATINELNVVKGAQQEIEGEVQPSRSPGSQAAKRASDGDRRIDVDLSAYTVTGDPIDATRKETFKVAIDQSKQVVNGVNDWVANVVGVERAPDQIDTVDQIEIYGKEAPIPVNIGEIINDHDEVATMHVRQGNVVLMRNDVVVEPVANTNMFNIEGDYTEYRIINQGEEKAVVEIEYPKTGAEEAYYTTFNAALRNIAKLKGKRVDLVMPNNVFRSGGKNSVGSRAWYMASVWEPLGLDINIETYDARKGLSAAAEVDIRPGAIVIVGAMESDIDKVERMKDSDPVKQRIKTFLEGKAFPKDQAKGEVRMMPALPDIKPSRGEWTYALDAQAIGLVQAALTGEDIATRGTGEANTADDMKKVLGQWTGKEVQGEYLYSLLSFDEMTQNFALPEEYAKTVLGQLRFLLDNLRLQKMEAYDATKEWQRRKKIMWAA